MTASVRPIEQTEVEAWCACPFQPGQDGFKEHVQDEHAWIARWYEGAPRLFACVDEDGALIGKYDVPIVFGKRWTLWAPSVRPGPGATDLMETLCEDLAARAEAEGVAYVKVLLEGGHASHEAAETGLAGAGFLFEEERVLVRANLTERRKMVRLLPDGVTIASASDLDLRGKDRILAMAVGLEEYDLDEIEADESGRPLWTALEEDGERIGFVLTASRPGATVLTEYHLGLVPEARGRGLGLPLLLALFAKGREAGSRLYIGSTATDNLAMRRIFALAGCEEFANRYIFGLELT